MQMASYYCAYDSVVVAAGPVSCGVWLRSSTNRRDIVGRRKCVWSSSRSSPVRVEQLPAVYAELRERFPVYRTGSNIWVISRFDDVKAVQSNPTVFSSRPNPYEGDSAPADAEMKPEVIERLMALVAGIPVDMDEMASAKTIAAADPPQHTRMRRIVSRGFTPPRIKEMADAISTNRRPLPDWYRRSAQFRCR